MDVVFLCKALDQIMLVLPNSARKVVRRSDVKCAIASTGKDVNVVLFHLCAFWIPAPGKAPGGNDCSRAHYQDYILNTFANAKVTK
jgi:hypothetical protein